MNFGFFLVLPITYLVIYLLGRIPGLKPQPIEQPVSPRELVFFNLKAMGLYLSIFLLVVYILSSIVIRISVSLLPQVQIENSLQPMTDAGYYLFSGVAACFISYILIDRWLGPRLLKNYDQCIRASDFKYGVNSRRFLNIGAVIALPLCLIANIHCCTLYSQVTSTHLRYKNFWSFHETVKDFKEIDSITLSDRFQAPNGNVLVERTYQVHFRDGTIWMPDDRSEGWKLIETLSDLSKIAIQPVALHMAPPLFGGP